MCQQRVRLVPILAAVLAAGSAMLRAADDPARTIRDGFESTRPVWRQEETDATIRLIAHDRSERAAHDGKLAEHFEFVAGPGSAFYYSYPLPKVPVTDALRAGLYVRSNRAGVQFFARAILPADTDPDTGQPSFVLVPGPVYENVDRWQRLDLVGMRVSVERQARVIRASTRRPVSTEGAYVDRFVINLYGGAGETEVFLDDLTMTPVPAEAAASHAAPPIPATNPAAEKPRIAEEKSDNRPLVHIDSGVLQRENYDWVFTAIRAPGADVGILRRAGFDVLADSVDADPKRWEEAAKRGFLLMPDLGGPHGAPPEPAAATAAATAFPLPRAVAFWNVGEHLGRGRDPNERAAELERVRSIASAFRDLPPGIPRLVTGEVDGDFPLYATPPRNLDLLGVRPNSWGGMVQPRETYFYLAQRRSLTALPNPRGLHWAWIPAAAPAAVRQAIWGVDDPPDWGDPQVQPEQVRMQTYLALSAGYRGVGFLGDAGLTRPPGRSRSSTARTIGSVVLNELALLNEEIDLVERIVAEGKDPISDFPTFPPDPSLLQLLPANGSGGNRAAKQKETAPHASIRAAGIRLPDRKGSLILLTDTEVNAQYQPPQMAAETLTFVVGAPDGAIAYEISPGGMKPLTYPKAVREPGGIRYTIRDFSVSALVLVTTDRVFAEQLEARLVPVRPKAVELAIDAADQCLRWVIDINQRIELEGHRIRSAPGLLALAEEYLTRARTARDQQDYATAWSEARRVGRPLRILMQDHFNEAVKAMSVASQSKEDRALLTSTGVSTSAGATDPKKKKKPALLIPPVASPACVAFNTLPAHYRYWVPWMEDSTYGAFSDNLVPSGSFDQPDTLKAEGWTDHSYQYDRISSRVLTVPDPANPKSRLLKMIVEPTDPKDIDNLPPFLDFPAAAVRSPAVAVHAGDFLRISVLVKRTVSSVAGVGGVIVQDSLGGEALQFRTTDAIPQWSRVVLYRRAPADGSMTVTLGLAGYAKDKIYEVYFDDFKVEVVEPLQTPSAPDVAGRARPGRSAPVTARRGRTAGSSSR